MGQLNSTERLQIETLISAGHNVPSIAKQLGRNKTSVYREISRNTYEDKYCHNAAQKQAEKRRVDAKKSILTEDNWTVVRSLIQQKWSPEQISAGLKVIPQ
jgi:IS30 family transposase